MRAVVNASSFIKQLNNIVQYGGGFVDGAMASKAELLKSVGSDVKEMLEQYIDVSARQNPQALQHVYEWYQVGQNSGRLFDISYDVKGQGISFNSTFSQSKAIKNGSSIPFYSKAAVMESGMSVTISPRKSSVLAFESDGETVFTSKPVTVTNPGGDDAAGSYEATFKEFFESYLSQSFLDVTNLREHLGTPLAFGSNFAAGAVGGRPVGIRAGRQWMLSRESVI